MIKHENLGVVTEVYVSNIVETDKGQKFYKGAHGEKGDILVSIDGNKSLVKPEVYKAEYTESLKKGVTQEMIDKAIELEIISPESMTKAKLLEAITLANEEALIGEGGLDD